MKINSFKIIFLLFFFINTAAEISTGFIERTYIFNGDHKRTIQIYYPTDKIINTDTKFIIVNDGEELFSEEDSWHGGAWNIDDSFLKLKKDGFNINLVIIAINSAKRNKGKIIDETRRYLEYFPQESISNFDEGFRKKAYSRLALNDGLNYPKFLVSEVVPFIEEKFNVKLDNSNMGIVGASMGGLSAINTILEYPEYFGFAGCLSTHWVGIKPLEYVSLPFSEYPFISGDPETTKAIKEYIEKKIINLNNRRIYFDHGTVGLDSLYGLPQEEINELFKKNNIDFQSNVFEGHDHETNFFGERFGPMIVYLLNL